MSNQDPDDVPAESRLRRRIVLLALPVLVSAAGAVAYLQFGSMIFGATESVERDSDGMEGDLEAQDMASADIMSDELTLMPLREIIVNISALTAAGEQTQRFLKLNLAIAYDEDLPGSARLSERSPYIRDSFVDYLRLLTESDLSGSAGLARLRAELLHRARSLAETDAAREVLIVDLVVQ
jgi:flagellar FliL protein